MGSHITALEGIPAYFSSPPSSNDVLLIDVTASHLTQIQELVTKSCLATLGTGKDQKHRQDKYDSLVVTKVTRVENRRLFARYTAQKNFMKKSSGQSAPLPHPLQSESNWTAAQGLDITVNESYLFHGTNPNYLESIATHGFDERLSGKGLYGYGIYFAENSSKSDQYCLPTTINSLTSSFPFWKQENRFHMILARVCLGTTQQVTSSQDIRRPAERTNSNGILYDSITGQLHGKYVERVVFDRCQCYPEFIIEYARV